MSDEREWFRGLLSREARCRLVVSGDIGPKELDNLIRLLELQKQFLAAGRPMTAADLGLSDPAATREGDPG
jgi:hypothetical protein